jgi:hypothetical protein
MKEKQGKDHETSRNSTDLEGAPRRTAMDPQRLIQRPIKRGAVVAELLPKPLLRLSIDVVGRRGVGPLLPLFQAR